MALPKETALSLLRVLEDERAFVDVVADALAKRSLEAMEAERLIISWYQDPPRLERRIALALQPST